MPRQHGKGGDRDQGPGHRDAAPRRSSLSGLLVHLESGFSPQAALCLSHLAPLSAHLALRTAPSSLTHPVCLSACLWAFICPPPRSPLPFPFVFVSGPPPHPGPGCGAGSRPNQCFPTRTSSSSLTKNPVPKPSEGGASRNPGCLLFGLHSFSKHLRGPRSLLDSRLSLSNSFALLHEAGATILPDGNAKAQGDHVP